MSTVIGPSRAPILRSSIGRFNLMVRWSADTGVFSIEDGGGFQSRNHSTIHLLTEAMRTARQRLRNSFAIPIFTDDFPPAREVADRCLAYCKSAEQDHVTLIPDFLFWSWPEVGIEDYEWTVEKILERSQLEPVDDRLFWIGSVSTHASRRVFMEIAARDSRIHACAMDWVAPSGADASAVGAAWGSAGAFVSLPEHCRYRTLIDLQGRGFSARLKLLMFSGRPVLIQHRRWREYFFDDLKPFVHYIPVEEDLSDLSGRLDWMDRHPAEARVIAGEAQKYAQRCLRRSCAVEYLARVLVGCSEE